ncbi:Hypothetical predicted protein [Lecanosticta acicola]|uniref:BTB domain-containing protein n=1 Tax=Lecanosticta acicola TaxID=111012 RepID=A0AAI8Z9K0_9PEZI|nr:Hypothetical predicted protein [Lecanosticta acicola]
MAPGQTIAVYIRRPGDPKAMHILTMPRDKLCRHSRAFRAFLENVKVEDEKNREIILPKGSPAALRHVLQLLLVYRGKQELYINLRDMTIKQSVMIWDAANEIGIEPVSARNKIMSVLAWRVSHEKMTPEIMQAVYDVFEPHRNSEDLEKKKLWDVLVHQYVWDTFHERFTEEERQALESVYVSLPPLGVAIANKQDELRSKKAQHEEWAEKNEIRGNNRREKKTTERKAHNEEERINRQVEEVVNGLRPMNAELQPYVLARERRAGSDGDAYSQ